MASPATAAAAYTAMLDAVGLGEAMEKGTDFDDALEIYNEDGVIRAKDLYFKSRLLAGRFAPNGFENTVSPSTLV